MASHPPHLSPSPDPVWGANTPLPLSWGRVTLCTGASHRSPRRACWGCRPSLNEGPVVQQGLAASLLRASQRHPSGLSSRRLTPSTNPQPGSKPPGLCLIWVFSPPPAPGQTALCGLKRQAWGVGGAFATAGSRAPPAVPPTSGLASPSLWLWRKPGPQSQAGQGSWLSIGVVAGVGSWNTAPLALPGSQPPSGFHLKPGLDPLL